MGRKKKYYFKVTDRQNMSCRTWNLRLSIEYFKDKWIGPSLPRSKSYVFYELEDAERFIRRTDWSGSGSDKIWRCEVKNPVKATCVMNTTGLTGSMIERAATKFWTGNLASITMIPAPDGTYEVDEVKLVKMVKRGTTVLRQSERRQQSGR